MNTKIENVKLINFIEDEKEFPFEITFYSLYSHSIYNSINFDLRKKTI